jgi:outer membrane protein TolC
MISDAGSLRMLAARRPWWIVVLCLAVGCSHHGAVSGDLLVNRILPPETSGTAAPHPELPAPAAAALGTPRTTEEPREAGAAEVPKADAGDTSAVPLPLDGQPQTSSVSADGLPCQPLTLPDAIALAFQLQPKLRAALENIRQAEGKQDIAFSAFLPVLTSAYSVGGFDLNVGGAGLPLPNSPPFNFIPGLGALPLGLDVRTGYELAELRLRWLVCDFGRRLGRYNQAGLAVDISQLQTQRAYQTVANDVALAYYQVLRTRSLHRIAAEGVRRAEDDLDVARKLGKGGVIEREKVLRAEVALAQAQRALDVAEEAQAVAVAALNLAIGLNVSTSTSVVDTADAPPFILSLADCLQAAVSNRRELDVARRSVQVAQEGSRAARADFAPRIVAGGDLIDFQQSSPRGHADLALGFIKLEWGVFEGGKRIAELDVTNAQIRLAMAEADAIADTIAFQINQAYRQLVAARKGIDRSRPAVEQSKETYRLVVARNRQGAATPAEVTDAATALTRAEQDYFNAVYDYLTAIARLEYAMGTTATPATAGTATSHR